MLCLSLVLGLPLRAQDPEQFNEALNRVFITYSSGKYAEASRQIPEIISRYRGDAALAPTFATIVKRLSYLLSLSEVCTEKWAAALEAIEGFEREQGGQQAAWEADGACLPITPGSAQ